MTAQYKQQPQQLLDELVDTFQDWYDVDGDIDRTWHPWYDPNIHEPHVVVNTTNPTAKIMKDYINLFLWMDDDYKPIDEKNAEVVNDKQSYFIYNTFYNIGFL